MKGLNTLMALNADQLCDLIKYEHPQTIAILLVHVKTEVASAVLSKLSDEIKTDVSMRIATSDKVISGMVEEVNAVFEELLETRQSPATHETGGVSRLAEIINTADQNTVEMILDEIEESDHELAAEIRQKMFVFEDIVLVDDKGLQMVLRSVETNELAMALKGGTEEVKEKIYQNMSERAAEMLKEEIDVLGAVRMKEVSDAQQMITRIIQEKEGKGELVISGRGGEEFIG